MGDIFIVCTSHLMRQVRAISFFPIRLKKQ